MLQRIAIHGIELPRLYIAENRQDVELAKKNGIPYIKWAYGQEQLVRQLLRPTLEKMFPGIRWTKVLGKKKRVNSKVVMVDGLTDDNLYEIADYDADAMLESQLGYGKTVDDIEREGIEEDHERVVEIATDKRDCAGGSDMDYSEFATQEVNVYDYIGDLSSYVDIDALQKLGLLPQFVGDIATCIKRNLSNSMGWTEGYNKKLGYPLGNFNRREQLPNLIIIDVSSSIPDGIAATMLTLADTLREQCNADLIITAARSGYYPSGCKLPDPQTLRDYYPLGNEGKEFMGILNKHIAGREFGNVISFGDYDNPGRCMQYYQMMPFEPVLTNTKVHAVYHYHTRDLAETGYARWVKEYCPDAEQHYDTSWCDVMK